jgi:hypothetical protein
VAQKYLQPRSNYSSAQRARVNTVPAYDEDNFDDAEPVRIPSSALHYQRLADVRTEVGRAPADEQVLSSQRSYRVSNRSTIPPRRSATQTSIPVVHGLRQREADTETNEIDIRNTDQLIETISRPRFHWTVILGMAMFTMLVGWVLLTMLANWWQVTQDDWHYGRPRTFQVDMLVGHNDSATNPSHFIAINLQRHVQIIEFPGGDASKAKIYTGPTLVGPGQELAVVTLTFKDVNGDGKLDMIVNVQDSHFVFINDHGQFRPVRPGENVQL